MSIAGRVVVLTGATGGIGLPLCRALVSAGATVLATGRREERLQKLAKSFPPGSVITVPANIATPQGRTLLLDTARQCNPAPSMLVMAHAHGAFELFEEQDPAQIIAMVETNLLASMLLAQAFLPQFLKQADATIAVLGSTFGSLAYPGFTAYSATKFGLRGFMEGLAREHADSHVRFQYLSPRATRTDFNNDAANALNEELGVACDDPVIVADRILRALQTGQQRVQIGWPEKLFARINGLFPEIIDRSLRRQLPAVRRHASIHSHPLTRELPQ